MWSPDKAYKLVKAIYDGYFVPPVIISATEHYHEKIPKDVYLIDGQQRLSAILLFCLGVWPNKEKSKLPASEDNEDETDAIEWTFTRLQKEYAYHQFSTLNDFAKRLIDTGRYYDIKAFPSGNQQLNKDIKDLVDLLQSTEQKSFIEKKTLGYSFIKSMASKDDEMRMFAHTFKNVNSSGVSLLPSEARNAMYYIEPKSENLLKPKFLESYKIGTGSIDFPRYISYVDESYRRYIKDSYGIPYCSDIALGYSTRQNDYINEYIVRVIDHYDVNKNYLDNMDKFEKVFREVFADKERCKLIYVFEFYVYGIIFWVLFDGKDINTINLTTIDT